MKPDRMFGPWAPGLDQAELRARLRSFRAIARLTAGPRATVLVDLLAKAEQDPAALVPAADALDRLEPVDRRRILASYAALGTRAQARPGLRVTPLHMVQHDPRIDPRRHRPGLRLAA